MNDDELRSALARRAAKSLGPDVRNDLIRAARIQALEPQRRPIGRRVGGWIIGTAAILVLAVIVAPILLSPPSNSTQPPKTAIAGPTAAPASDAATGVRIYTAHELAAMVGDRNWIGKTVLAEAAFDRVDLYGECPPPIQPCVRGALQGVDQHGGVLFGWRDATAEDGVQFDDGNGYRWVKKLDVPTDAGVFAFTVQDENAEYLGPAQFGPDSKPFAVGAVPAETERTPTDRVFVVSGWWSSGLWPNCPAFGETPHPDLSFLCQGSWITAAPIDPSTIPAAGLELPAGPYPDFADQRSPGKAVQGTFVARSAGCQRNLDGRCPVWRLVGRLDEATSPPPAPTPLQTPSPAPASNGVRVNSAQELAAMIGDARRVGDTVLAELPIGAIVPAECPATAPPCNQATLSVDGTTYPVTIGTRDATETDGTQYDDGNGYRWIKQLAPPSDAGIYAFTLQQHSAEYLGPAYVTPSGEPVTVADIQGISSTLPSDGVIAVDGWLVKNWPPPPCAAPPEMLETPRPALDYYCYGTWLTPTGDANLDQGVRVQNDAYEFFALNPLEDENGVSPQHGVYLVRNAGCPIQAPCPAWRMVGRLDDVGPPSGPSRSPSQLPPTTPVSSSPVIHVSNGTTLRLNVLINDQLAAMSQPQSQSTVDPSPYPQPWHVVITTESGRQLVDFSYTASDVWGTDNSDQGVATRVDLSCGRLDVYSGPPLLGPGPPASFASGDCVP